MNKITSSSADYQNFQTLFEHVGMAGEKVTVDFRPCKLLSSKD